VFDAVNAIERSYSVLGFIVDAEYGQPGTEVNGKPILGGFDWVEKHASSVRLICGVGAPQHRIKLIRRAEASGGRFVSVVHPSATMTRWIDMGEGVVITAGCVLTNRIRLGDHVHLNLLTTLGHDGVLGDFATTAPGVNLSGNVTLGEGAYVGAGANVIEKVSVGRWSIVGAGSTVIRDVPPNTTCVGTPATAIKERPDGWHLK
jgi:sugar O-acyltransferase (sialic acid O-acetyltransferase NeuD family)